MNKDEAIKWLKIYCGGNAKRFTWVLTGNSKRTARKHILEVLTGEKVKSGHEGITRLTEELYRAFGPITPGCNAAMEEELFIKMGI